VVLTALSDYSKTFENTTLKAMEELNTSKLKKDLDGDREQVSEVAKAQIKKDYDDGMIFGCKKIIGN